MGRPKPEPKKEPAPATTKMEEEKPADQPEAKMDVEQWNITWVLLGYSINLYIGCDINVYFCV